MGDAHDLPESYTQPAFLFHGNTFYPMGHSLTFAESLFTPSLLGGPLYVLSGNPVLAYNLTLLLVWALSGWAMYAVAFRVTGAHVAAFVAAAVFTLCPDRTDYYVEFQIETSSGSRSGSTRWSGSSRSDACATSRRSWRFLGPGGRGPVLRRHPRARGSLPGGRVLGAVLGRLASAGARGGRVGGVALGGAFVPAGRAFFVTRRELGFERSLRTPPPAAPTS